MFALVGCTKKKLEVAAPAGELYAGGTFRRIVERLRADGVAWGIASAKHGLVMPEEVLEPYDVSLYEWDDAARLVWGERVAEALVGRGVKGEVAIYADEVYAGALEPALRARGFEVVLKGWE